MPHPHIFYNAFMAHDEPENNKDCLISLPEAAEIYGFSANYLNELARRGRLQAQKVGTSWVTTPQAVEEYIRSREPRGAYRNDIQLDEDCD